MDHAIRIMESLRRLPLARGTQQASEVTYEIGRRLAGGWTEEQLRLRLDRPLPPGGIGSVAAFLKARVVEIPLRPPAAEVVGSEAYAVDVAARAAQLGAPMYARTGERPGTVDVGANGGWREIMRQRQEDS